MMNRNCYNSFYLHISKRAITRLHRLIEGCLGLGIAVGVFVAVPALILYHRTDGFIAGGVDGIADGSPGDLIIVFGCLLIASLVTSAGLLLALPRLFSKYMRGLVQEAAEFEWDQHSVSSSCDCAPIGSGARAKFLTAQIGRPAVPREAFPDDIPQELGS